MFHKVKLMSIQKNVVSTFAFFASLLLATPALAQDTFTVHNVGHLSGQGQLESGDQIIRTVDE